ncbi:MAG: phosphoribosylanthranilate isomerase [Sulfobacillus benefaciens]|uniref:N-(5'-phosphoribosyl)anthranilate isomerase n=1 Tax=Sulfobacillus benefaciens TaxID=453960 RepID=A0A2T2XJT4_9FIRM|nr:MAG: phosphoribosylanthranilate isomerase [Sulfobacillus benefaciens]
MATTVKICGVRDKATAKFCFAHGADFVGLVFAPSRRQISLGVAQQIVQEIPGRYVAVVNSPDAAALLEIIQKIRPYAIQHHGEPMCEWLELSHGQGIAAIATTLDPRADIVLLDGPIPGQGQERQWERPAWPKPLWLAGGLSPKNVREVVCTLRPDGVDVSSGVESQGNKDWRLIAAFIEEAKSWNE